MRHWPSRRGVSPGGVVDEGSAVAVRGDGDSDSLRFACGGLLHPCCASVEAILIVAPSNRSRPAVLAADALPDLHVIDPPLLSDLHVAGRPTRVALRWR